MTEDNATIRDIDEKSITKFIIDSKDHGRLPETNRLSIFQILEKLKLTDGKKLKRAAIIMFGKDPMKFYPNVQVKIGRFGADSADLRFQEVVESNLVHMLNEVEVQLNYKFLTRPVKFEGFQRKENNLYPIDALREMLLNAVVHRTYMGAAIQIRVYDDHLSIWNEGSLPYGLSLEDLKKEHNSRPRNPVLANACFLGGYIDAWGRGTLKIINSCKEAGLIEPEIIEKNGGLAMTLFALNYPVAISKNVTKTSEKTLEKIINAIRLNPRITIAELSEFTGVTTRSVERNIESLKKSKRLQRIGSDKDGYWKITVN